MATVKLGDIAIEAKSSNKGDKTGIRIVGLEHLTPSNVTLSSWSEDTENTFTKEFSKGDVLFGRRRAYLKKAAVAPFDGICSGDITVIRAIEDKVDPDLLPFIIQNDFLFDFAVGKSAGSLSPRVKWTHLKEFTIDLPSMPEQSKLAETLWSINETKNAYEDLINKTDELVKSKYLTYAIRSQEEQLLSRVTGSLVRHISAKSLKTVIVPILLEDAQNHLIELERQSDKSKFALQEAIKDLDALSKKIIAENLIPAGKE